MYSCHWAFADVLYIDKCVPRVDILATKGHGPGYNVIYENRMLQSFASSGFLESSVLDMYDGSNYGHPSEFYYKACVPNDSALEFWFRGGATVEACTTSAWIGPFRAQAGVDSASFDIYDRFGCVRFFQYKVVFRGDTSDIAVLKEVGLGYQACPYGVDEGQRLPRKLSLKALGGSRIRLELPYSSPVKIEVYEPTGRLVASEERSLQDGVHELRVPGRGLRLVKVKVEGKGFMVKVW